MLKLYVLVVLLALTSVAKAVVDPCYEYQCSVPAPENCPEGCKFDGGCYFWKKTSVEGQCVCSEPKCHEIPGAGEEPHSEPTGEPKSEPVGEPKTTEPVTPKAEPHGEEPHSEPTGEPKSEPVGEPKPTEPVSETPKEPHGEVPHDHECHCEPTDEISTTVKCHGTDIAKYYCMPTEAKEAPKKRGEITCGWVEKKCPVGVQVVINGDLTEKTAEIIATITQKVQEALGNSGEVEIVVKVKTFEGKTTVTVLVKGSEGQTINVDTKAVTDAAVSELLASGYSVESTTNIGEDSSASTISATLFVVIAALLVSLI